MNTSKQSGIALVISLVMLLMITLLAVTAMSTSALEQKMSGNSLDRELAFQAAETALRDAEVWLVNQSSEPDPNSTGTNRVWTFAAMDPDNTNAKNWWNEVAANWWTSSATQSSQSLGQVNSQPRYVIEYRQFISDDLLIGNGTTTEGQTYYQVTAKGTGGSDHSRVLLQSTVTRRY